MTEKKRIILDKNIKRIVRTAVSKTIFKIEINYRCVPAWFKIKVRLKNDRKMSQKFMMQHIYNNLFMIISSFLLSFKNLKFTSDCPTGIR